MELTVQPAVDLSHLATAERYFIHGAHSLKAFQELRDPLRALLPSPCLIKPGTTFGPLSGTAEGQIGDLVFPLPWILLVRAKALRLLEATGVKGLIAVQAHLKFLRQTVRDDFFEIQIEPHAMVVHRVLPLTEEEQPSCSVCGYRKSKIPEPLLLQRSSIPTMLDLFRGKDLTTFIFATEHFVNSIEKLGLKGLVYEEVQVTDIEPSDL